MKFDIEKYASRSNRVDLEGIDFDAFRDQPLDEQSLRCLRYMHDVEFHTVCYLRDLLVTRAHTDPAITTFLTMWNFEEHWHGDAISRVLDAHDEISGARRVEQVRIAQGPFDKFKPLVNMLGSAIFKDFPAVHMTWGAINEWVTQGGYSRLITLADHEVLTDLLRRLMKQEGRHVDFYASQAEERLERSKRAQFVTRQLLKRKWAPVGSGVMPDPEVRFMANHLFGGPEGREVAARVDRNIDRLPGLGGLGLVTTAVSVRETSAEAIDLR